jgi:DNA-directed RNA polymerase beta' subunit
VPKSIAKRLTVPVVVNALNIAAMRECVLRGTDELGGALYVRRGVDGEIFDLNFAGSLSKIARTLEVGDTVERMLRDGDAVVMNRQPSLHKVSDKRSSPSVHARSLWSM